jgi:DNA-binding response OmpR family regulator
MPGMSGLEFVTHLRAEPDLATIPVLFYTAWYDDYDTRKAMRDYGYAVLAKPVAVSEVVTQIDTILRGRAGQERP